MKNKNFLLSKTIILLLISSTTYAQCLFDVTFTGIQDYNILANRAQSLTGIRQPINPSDIVNKAYVDNMGNGVSVAQDYTKYIDDAMIADTHDIQRILTKEYPSTGNNRNDLLMVISPTFINENNTHRPLINDSTETYILNNYGYYFENYLGNDSQQQATNTFGIQNKISFHDRVITPDISNSLINAQGALIASEGGFFYRLRYTADMLPAGVNFQTDADYSKVWTNYQRIDSYRYGSLDDEQQKGINPYYLKSGNVRIINNVIAIDNVSGKGGYVLNFITGKLDEQQEIKIFGYEDITNQLFFNSTASDNKQAIDTAGRVDNSGDIDISNNKGSGIVGLNSKNINFKSASKTILFRNLRENGNTGNYVSTRAGFITGDYIYKPIANKELFDFKAIWVGNPTTTDHHIIIEDDKNMISTDASILIIDSDVTALASNVLAEIDSLFIGNKSANNNGGYFIDNAPNQNNPKLNTNDNQVLIARVDTINPTFTFSAANKNINFNLNNVDLISSNIQAYKLNTKLIKAATADNTIRLLANNTNFASAQLSQLATLTINDLIFNQDRIFNSKNATIYVDVPATNQNINFNFNQATISKIASLSFAYPNKHNSLIIDSTGVKSTDVDNLTTSSGILPNVNVLYISAGTDNIEINANNLAGIKNLEFSDITFDPTAIITSHSDSILFDKNLVVNGNIFFKKLTLTATNSNKNITLSGSGLIANNGHFNITSTSAGSLISFSGTISNFATVLISNGLANNTNQFNIKQGVIYSNKDIYFKGNDISFENKLTIDSTLVAGGIIFKDDLIDTADASINFNLTAGDLNFSGKDANFKHALVTPKFTINESSTIKTVDDEDFPLSSQVNMLNNQINFGEKSLNPEDDPDYNYTSSEQPNKAISKECFDYAIDRNNLTNPLHECKFFTQDIAFDNSQLIDLQNKYTIKNIADPKDEKDAISRKDLGEAFTSFGAQAPWGSFQINNIERGDDITLKVMNPYSDYKRDGYYVTIGRRFVFKESPIKSSSNYHSKKGDFIIGNNKYKYNPFYKDLIYAILTDVSLNSALTIDQDWITSDYPYRRISAVPYTYSANTGFRRLLYSADMDYLLNEYNENIVGAPFYHDWFKDYKEHYKFGRGLGFYNIPRVKLISTKTHNGNNTIIKSNVPNDLTANRLFLITADLNLSLLATRPVGSKVFGVDLIYCQKNPNDTITINANAPNPSKYCDTSAARTTSQQYFTTRAEWDQEIDKSVSLSLSTVVAPDHNGFGFVYLVNAPDSEGLNSRDFWRCYNFACGDWRSWNPISNMNDFYVGKAFLFTRALQNPYAIVDHPSAEEPYRRISGNLNIICLNC